MPISFSNEELALLRSLAEPIAFGRRHAELANCEQTGPGMIFRTAVQIQRNFVLTSQPPDRETPPQPSASKHTRA
jgi:hypothetical protein